jgi:hypothetical protein
VRAVADGAALWVRRREAAELRQLQTTAAKLLAILDDFGHGVGVRINSGTPPIGTTPWVFRAGNASVIFRNESSFGALR